MPPSNGRGADESVRRARFVEKKSRPRRWPTRRDEFAPNRKEASKNMFDRPVEYRLAASTFAMIAAFATFAFVIAAANVKFKTKAQAVLANVIAMAVGAAFAWTFSSVGTITGKEGPVAFAILGAAAVVFFVRTKTKIANSERKWAIATFFAYVAVVAFVTLFSREAGGEDSIKLSLAEFVDATFVHPRPGIVRHFVLNVAMFVPAGFAYAAIEDSGIRILEAAAAGGIWSCAIETTQLQLSSGQCDVSDLIGNVAGAAIGAAAFVLVEAILKRRKGDDDDEDYDGYDDDYEDDDYDDEYDDDYES